MTNQKKKKKKRNHRILICSKTKQDIYILNGNFCCSFGLWIYIILLSTQMMLSISKDDNAFENHQSTAEILSSVTCLIIWCCNKLWPFRRECLQAVTSFRLFTGGGSNPYRDISIVAGGLPALTRSYSFASMGCFWDTTARIRLTKTDNNIFN